MPTDKRELDPGAYIGREPELEEESIPGGLKPGDERVAAYDSQPGVDGEPDGPPGESAEGGAEPSPNAGVGSAG
jgi:hypothetical protein